MTAPAGLIAQLAELGAATAFEASGRHGFVDADLQQVVPGSRAAGPARVVHCAQDDNLMVHAAMPLVQPGEILVVSMPEPAPVALVGDLLATQAKHRGAAAILVDAAIRDREEIAAIGLPVWSRWTRVQGPTRRTTRRETRPAIVGGQPIASGDLLVLDADGVAVIPHDRLEQVVAAAAERVAREQARRARLEAGELTYEIDSLARLFR